MILYCTQYARTLGFGQPDKTSKSLTWGVHYLLRILRYAVRPGTWEGSSSKKNDNLIRKGNCLLCNIEFSRVGGMPYYQISAVTVFPALSQSYFHKTRFPLGCLKNSPKSIHFCLSSMQTIFMRHPRVKPNVNLYGKIGSLEILI